MNDYEADRRSVLKITGGTLLTTSVLSSGTASGQQAGSADAAVSYDVDYRPSQDGVVDLSISLTVDSSVIGTVGSISWSIPFAEPVNTNGITNIGGSTYEWDEASVDASVTCRINTASDYNRLQESSDNYAILKVGPDFPDGASITESIANGVRSKAFLVFGDYTRITESAGGKSFDFFVVDEADRTSSLSDVVDFFAFCVRELDVSGSVDDLTVFVTDTLGPEANSATIFELSLSLPGAFAHEYVHTQLDRVLYTEDSKWLREAEAEWYEYLTAYRAGLISWDAIWKDIGPDKIQDGVVLADEQTWGSNSDYHKGGLVLAHLDGRIRRETNGEHTYLDVTKELNNNPSASNELALQDFTQELTAVCGSSMSGHIDTYVRDTWVPDPPERHLFHDESAAISPGGRRGFEIQQIEFPKRVPVNGQLEVDVTVRNTGFKADKQEVRLGLAEDEFGFSSTQDAQTLDLDRGDQKTVTLSGIDRESDATIPGFYGFRVKTDDTHADGGTSYGDYTLFGIQDINSPNEVGVGNPIEVTAEINDNSSDADVAMTATVELVNESDGTVIDSVEITTSEQYSQVVSLRIAGTDNDSTGSLNYIVRTKHERVSGIDSSKSGSVAIVD